MNVEITGSVKMIVKVGKIFFPKDTSLLKPNIWASFSAYPKRILTEGIEIDDIINPTYYNIKMSGRIPKLTDDTEYEVIAELEHNEKYGDQWKIISMKNPTISLEDGEEGLTFLRAILTEKQYNDITQLPNPIKVLESGDIDTLTKIKGIGKKNAEKIIGKYEANKGASSDILAFAKFDLTENEIKLIMEHFSGNSTIAVQSIMENPYCLTDIKGFGFRRVDDIALRNNLVGEHDVKRVEAYIEYLFEDMAQNEGSTWAWTDNVYDCIMSELELDSEQVISDSLYNLLSKKKIITNKQRTKVALKKYWDLEKGVADNIKRLLKAEPKIKPLENWKELIKRTEQEQGFKFTQEQYDGIVNNLENNVVITYARAGAGKTSAVNGTLNCFPKDAKILQVALSGKASDNLKNITGKESMTIHRALKWNPQGGGYAYDKNNPLDIDILIMEEFGMNNLTVTLPLLNAVPDGCRVYMLGDVSQISAIGAGALLRDMINSQVVPTNHYTKVMRQSEDSRIKPISYDIADGKQIFQKREEYTLDKGDLKEIMVVDKDNIPHLVMEEYINYVNQGIPKEDIVILCPIKNKGENSCFWYNNEVQKIWHDVEKEEYIIGGIGDYKFKIFVGDRILNKKNNYNMERDGVDYSLMSDLEKKMNSVAIFNGMTGTVVDLRGNSAVVKFDNGDIIIVDAEQLKNTTLGYSYSIHASQGQTIPYTIFTVDYSAYKLLNRNILYTGLTRAKEKCCLIAQMSAFKYGVSQSEVNNRMTFLEDLLKNIDK